jgi:PAS domain S-box-containing protein
MYNDGMFRELVENSDDIIIVTDQEFKIRYVSSSVTRAFGIDPLEVLGKHIFTFVNRKKIERWKNFLESRLHTSFHDEISIWISENKRVYFDVHISKLSNRSNIEGMTLRLHDVTEKKSKENELIKSNQQLDQVIYKTTHDLKAPLMSAMGLVALAEKAPEKEKGKYLGLIKKSLTRLDAFLDEMTDFFRIEKLAIQREKINIVQLLNDELEDLKNLYEQFNINIALETEGNADFYSDTLRVRTIVANILSNAIKYRDPKKTEPFIRISVYIDEENCEIRFVDNGIGIDPQYHEKIFDLFFRATSHSEGTGLGLFIVKDTIEKLRGRIEVSSRPDQGTTFTIRLPNNIYQPIEAE